MTNRTFIAAALVTLAACGGDDASPERQPAGSQTPPPAAKPMTYRECMNTPGAQSEAERERACMTLPDAPR